MKALAIYIAITAVTVNVVGNVMQSTADGIRQAQERRTERLCKVNTMYCN